VSGQVNGFNDKRVTVRCHGQTSTLTFKAINGKPVTSTIGCSPRGNRKVWIFCEIGIELHNAYGENACTMIDIPLVADIMSRCM